MDENLEVIKNTGEVLEDYSSSGRRRPWQKHKLNNEKLFKLYLKANAVKNILSKNRLQDLLLCGDELLFVADEKNKKLKTANFCKVRTCPMCNWRRSMKLFSQVSDVSEKIILENPAVKFLFVTLTIRNVVGDELSKALNEMNKGFQNLTHNSNKWKASDKLRNNLLGYMKAIEVTYNSERNDFHPHIHCIFAMKSSYFHGDYYMNKKQWAKLWGNAMKLNYNPSIDVRVISGTAKAVAEVAKYPVKLDKILEHKKNVVALIELHNAIKSRKLVTFGGIFKTIKAELQLDDIEDGDLINAENEKVKLNPVAYILYKWRAKVGMYIC